MNKKIVMGLSGGMDSATLLGYYLNEGAEVHCCNFQYGSKHNRYEFAAFGNVINYYVSQGLNKIFAHNYNLVDVFSGFKSNLLHSGGEIPEGHYNDENMKKTVVPGRNTIFISIMLGLAQSINADIIALGVHAGDHHIYPDCRREYMEVMHIVVSLASEGQVSIETPFININKGEILKIGYTYAIKVPYEFTHTCYKEQFLSCGKCGSCRERLEAFELIGIKDPIEYEQ